MTKRRTAMVLREVFELEFKRKAHPSSKLFSAYKPLRVHSSTLEDRAHIFFGGSLVRINHFQHYHILPVLPARLAGTTPKNGSREEATLVLVSRRFTPKETSPSLAGDQM